MSLALVFEQYGDGKANKGISRYAITPDAIHVQFDDDRVYVYSNEKPGTQHVEAMKHLARQGAGLSTYISQRVQHRYERCYRLTSVPSS